MDLIVLLNKTSLLINIEANKLKFIEYQKV